ncbi:hypothetical protein RCL1_000743 [Eukaryota sp. TZLM3-RCL]
MTAPSVNVAYLVEEILSAMDSAGIATLSSEMLEVLDILLPSTLEAALEIIDSGSISGLVGDISGRMVSTVSGTTGQQYVVLNNYCSCAAFSFSVMKDQSIMCKHQLAVRLAHILKVVPLTQVPDFQIAYTMVSLTLYKDEPNLISFEENF